MIANRVKTINLDKILCSEDKPKTTARPEAQSKKKELLYWRFQEVACKTWSKYMEMIQLLLVMISDLCVVFSSRNLLYNIISQAQTGLAKYRCYIQINRARLPLACCRNTNTNSNWALSRHERDQTYSREYKIICQALLWIQLDHWFRNVWCMSRNSLGNKGCFWTSFCPRNVFRGETWKRRLFHLWRLKIVQHWEKICDF